MQVILSKKGKPTWFVQGWQMINLSFVVRIEAEAQIGKNWPLHLTTDGEKVYTVNFESEGDQDQAFFALLEALGGSPAAENPDYDLAPYESVLASEVRLNER